MTTPQAISWQEEAKRLHADGMSVQDIARKLGKAGSSVRYVVCDRTRERERARRRDGYKPSGTIRGGYERSFVKAHIPRVIPKSTVDTMAVCCLFASGKIDRAELSLRLRGGA